MKNTVNFIALAAVLYLTGCQSKKLPYMGEPESVTKSVDGKPVEKLVYPVIPAFTFINQNGDSVTDKSFTGKIYVADFFFTTCPTICPVMKKNMLKVYQAYKANPAVGILSHTIDPSHDTVEVLHQYAQDMGVTGTMWHFVTGDRDKIYSIGENHYMVRASEDSTEAGGFVHSGRFVLVDKDKHIRGMYDGTTDSGTEQLIEDIAVLLKEN